MKRIMTLCTAMMFCLSSVNSQTLSLDSCRAMALRSNKQLGVSRTKQKIAEYTRKAARTKYLPHLDIAGGWFLSDKEVSILNNSQKSVLSNLGTIGITPIAEGLVAGITDLENNHILEKAEAEGFRQLTKKIGSNIAEKGNALGNEVKDAFRTDTRSVIVASAIINQPLYMGGAITAANRMADITEKMAEKQYDVTEQTVMYDIDQAYWLVVSLSQKQRLAESFLNLVSKLDKDVHKMIDNGVATRADGLKVDVKVNEAEMAKSQVDNGLALSKMLLCQLCGLPVESEITLKDELSDDLNVSIVSDQYDHSLAASNRTELRLLDDAISMSEQMTKLTRAAILPQVMLTGGYLISNPNVFNGFERKFSGLWNLGVLVRIPVFDWGENMYKVRATKVATDIARMEYDETKEKIELQVSQSDFRLRDANKRLVVAQKNILRAEENLRCANLGFSEGVIEATEVMAAQTAWLQAKTQKIDAQIDVRMSEVGLKKALGIR